MRTHVICIGNELLRGHTLNTNLGFLGEQFSRLGYEIQREVCVPDERDILDRTVRSEAASADLVVTIGGLGPTSDDITREAVAGALDLPLHLDEEVLQRIRGFLHRRHVSVPSTSVRTQAMVPEGAEALHNRNGTAPGLWYVGPSVAVAMLPGPPREFRPMVVDSLLPLLKELSPPQVISRDIRVCGLGESVAAQTVESVLKEFDGVTLAYCAQPVAVSVRLTVATGQADVLDEATARVRDALGDAALPRGCPNVAQALGHLLTAKGWWLATAESCTGGAIAKAVTDNPGASAYFKGSVVSYADECKRALLGVRPDTLSAHGSVSAEAAGEMLDGVMTSMGAQVAVAVTGIAGPEGETADKPVGLVYIAVGVKDRRDVRRYLFPGNRESVRRRTVMVALNGLRKDLLHHTGR